MTTRLDHDQLDEILALQLTIAWAGESAGEPPRLGWWSSDLVDVEGGRDLFARLVPKTAKWASLSLVREVARSVDSTRRASLAAGDRVWTLFHFGFAVDEQLDDRISYHRQHRHQPSTVLGESFLVGRAWSRTDLESVLQALGAPNVETTPAGRKLATTATHPLDAARSLAAALMPLAPSYPMPFLHSPT